MASPQHVVIRRININGGFGFQDGRAVGPAWLERKLRPFESICLPSVLGQDLRAFSSLLPSSDETPEPYRERILACCWDPLVLVHEMGEYSLPRIGGLVGELTYPATTHLVTSRVDADDAFLSLIGAVSANRSR